MNERIIAIGDIHGCSVALAALLDAVNPQPSDTIVTLGDYVDGGIDSRGVLDSLLALRHRCHLVPLLGNHDAMMLAAIEEHSTADAWLSTGGTSTLQSYPDERLDSVPAEHAEFLRDCRLCHQAKSHFFVHASYRPDLPLDQQPEAVLLWESIREGLPGPHSSGKIAVVGHTAQKDGEILDADHIICIDTYCWGGGWLTGLDVLNGQIWQVDERGRIRSHP